MTLPTSGDASEMEGLPGYLSRLGVPAGALTTACTI
jgi:hypothetical protein